MFSFNRPDDPDANEKPSLLTSFTLKGWLSNNKTKSDSDDSSTNSPHGRAWIKGVVICARVITTILAINITMAITAVGLAYSKNREQDFSFAAVYTGKCSLAKNWMTGLHLIINILSTVLLGASNYCMQCLASPSRAQVDKAHSKRVWVPIGVPNIWGLLWSDRGKRQLLGWMLLATSLPIHLIYNSAIFLSNSPTDYTVLIAPPGPMNGTGSEGWNSCFNATVGLDIETVRAEMSRSDLKKLSVKDCIDTFAQDFVSGQRMAILVTEDPIPDGEPLAFMGLTDPFDFDHVGSSFYTINRGFDWMCSEEDVCSKDFVHDMVKGKEWNVQPLTVYTLEAEVQVPTENGFQNFSWPFYPEDYQTPDMERLNEVLQQARHEGEVQAALHDPSSWSNASFPGNVTVFRYSFQCPEYSGLGRMEQKVRIKHCLTVPKDESCRLMFSLPICLVVIMCNLIKLICALLTARDGREELFLTVGDAIASYLAYPDPTTEGSCLLSRWLVGKGSQGWRRKTKKNDMLGAPSHSNLPLQISPRKRWFQAASSRLWISTITLFVCILVLSILALVIAFPSSADVTRGTIWDNTIGEPRPQSLINMRTPDGVMGIFVMILLSNGLQFFVSIAYFMLNALMTAMLGAAEYNDYAQNRKQLRVSWPRGAQRSTYYLSLPYRYSFPLLIVSAVLHWLVSESLFFVQVISFDINDVPSSATGLSTCGYSPVAIMFAIIVGGSLFIVALLLSLRRFDSPMPLLIQCSAAISAACHPTTSSMDDTADHALKSVQWGEIPGIYSDRGPMVFSHQIESDDDAGGDRSANEELQQMLPIAGPNDSSSTGAATLQLYHCTFTSEDVCEPRKGRVYA